MDQLVFTNIAYLGNAGDYWSSPLKYYLFPKKNPWQIHFLDLYGASTGNIDYKDYTIKNKTIVIGGGGLISSKDFYLYQTIEWLLKKNKVIFWGVGSNSFKSTPYNIFKHKNVLLLGTRDYSDFLYDNYVPCVSCKHASFDLKYSINDSIGLLEHPNHPINIPNLPKISNTESIKDIIEFIGTKEILISSTFHGVYWSQLLDKKVLYYLDNDSPNTKYFNLKHRVPVCNEKNYLSKIKNISNTSGLKEESRYLNDEFYKKVLDII